MSELQTLTIDVINSLSGSDRYYALLRYHAWIKKKRLEERVIYTKQIRRKEVFVFNRQRVLIDKCIMHNPSSIHHRITIHEEGIFDNLMGWIEYD